MLGLYIQKVQPNLTMAASNPSSGTPMKKNLNKIIYILLIIILLVINGLLFFNNLKTNNENEELTKERDELMHKKAEYELKIDSLIADLEAYAGINASLDSIIQAQKNELLAQKIAFDKKLSNKDFELAQLKRELDEKIKELERENNKVLAELENWKLKYEQVVEEKRELEDTIVSKEITIKTLEKKIEKGNILSAQSIETYGVRYKSNSKEVKTDRAKRVEKLVVCFKLGESRIADPGYRTIYIRIINPEGNTLAIQSMGSGTFTLAESGESSLYTKKVTIDYEPDNPEKLYCTDWFQETGFMPGDYGVEVYQDGYMIGTSGFSLRKGGLF